MAKANAMQHTWPFWLLIHHISAWSWLHSLTNQWKFKKCDNSQSNDIETKLININYMIRWLQRSGPNNNPYPCLPRPTCRNISSHALCWTNAVQWRGRYFNGAIGSAVPRSVFSRCRDGRDFINLVTWANHATCTALWTLAGTDDTQTTGKTIFNIFSPFSWP